MPGGEMSLLSRGEVSDSLNDLLFTGNPSRSLFSATYKKVTPYGLQKFRLDFDGQRDLRVTEPSTFTFKVKRYGDILLDTYVMIQLPDIYSPIYPPCENTRGQWVPYEFKWIPNLGTQMLKEVIVSCGTFELQRYTNKYLMTVADRDMDATQREKYNRMTGHVPELHSPDQAFDRVNVYPNAFVSRSSAGAEPSIRGRSLCIPLGAWFTHGPKVGFPLVSCSKNVLTITVTLRPIQELFVVRDVFDHDFQFPHIQPDFTQDRFQLWRFLQTPPSVELSASHYNNKTNTWNADVHLYCTQAFLSEGEHRRLAQEPCGFLIKDVIEHTFLNVAGASRQRIPSNGLVSSWSFFFQRNDVNMRNEWSNYTNHPYHVLPSNVRPAPVVMPAGGTYELTDAAGPYFHADGSVTGLFITGDANRNNDATIAQTLGIVLNGEFRENTIPIVGYDPMETYTRTQGLSRPGLYHYHFGWDGSSDNYQPSGGQNMSVFKTIDVEYSTFLPSVDKESVQVQTICGENGPVEIGKYSWRLFEYNYDFTLIEERYNIISFIGGNCGLLYAK
jgi:hypothetical protein